MGTTSGVSIVEGSEGGGGETGALILREASMAFTERTEDEMISRTFHRQSRVLLTLDGEENHRDTFSWRCMSPRSGSDFQAIPRDNESLE